jgi:hypothetical protein
VPAKSKNKKNEDFGVAFLESFIFSETFSIIHVSVFSTDVNAAAMYTITYSSG